MSQSVINGGLDVKRSLLDAVLAGLIALIVFGPIVGIVLNGYSFNFEPHRLVWIIVAVMVGRLLLSLFLQTAPGRRVLARFDGGNDGVYVRPLGDKSNLRWFLPLMAAIALLFPFVATKYLLTVAILGLIYVLLGLGLNIVVGLAGLLDLGYVAFYAIGAYGLALGYQYLGLGFWAMLPLGALMAALAGRGWIIAGANNWCPAGDARRGVRPGIRPARQRRRRADPRVSRHRLQPESQVHFHLRGAVFGGAAGAVHQAPADAHADRPRLGGAARR